MQVHLNEDERIDQLYSKGIQIIQSKTVFSFSLDAVFLADFVRTTQHKTKQIVDMCAGNGAVGLFLSEKTSSPIFDCSSFFSCSFIKIPPFFP